MQRLPHEKGKPFFRSIVVPLWRLTFGALNAERVTRCGGVLCLLLFGAGGPLGCPVDTLLSAEPPRWAAPELEKSISVRDGRTDRVLTLDAVIGQLDQSDVVFLGEQHNDETTHRFELAVYDRLLARRSGRVVLALEMFQRDVQKTLTDYVTGRITETSFLAQSRPWGNYATAYRPLIERAKEAKAHALASNFPRPLQMSQKGSVAEFAALQQQFPDQVPRKVFPNSPEYWRRVDNAIRGHLAMMRQSTRDSERLYSTQSLWDNTMGETCARALDEFPGCLVMHVNGGFHSAYWDGTVHQLKLRRPKTRVQTVAIVPVADPMVAEQSGKPVADFVVFVEARATGPNEGAHSVYVQRELKYKLHMPKKKEMTRLPLLLWMSDDGFTADDGLELWKRRLGDDVAIAVIEAPYRETQEDFSVGGRWYWPDEFTADVGTLVGGVERVWAYLLRHYPIDPARVCLAGEGTGATVAAAVAALTDRMDVHAVAVRPRRYANLKDFPLPLPELLGDDLLPRRTLHVLDAATAKSWWAPELAQYSDVGVSSRFEKVTEDLWNDENQEENLIRVALEMKTRPLSKIGQKRYILVPDAMPRARHWARLQSLRAEAAGKVRVAVVDKKPDDSTAQPLHIAIDAESFMAGGKLPRCPGPFGGTTVLVLPIDLPKGQVDAWLALEQNDPLARTSRFYRIRIAMMKGTRNLPAVLDKLRSEGRKNVLVVPAVFCADPGWMRSLRTLVRPQEDQMTLHWLPGLGGCEVPGLDR